jgi:hypothetical protein
MLNFPYKCEYLPLDLDAAYHCYVALSQLTAKQSLSCHVSIPAAVEHSQISDLKILNLFYKISQHPLSYLIYHLNTYSFKFLIFHNLTFSYLSFILQANR